MSYFICIYNQNQNSNSIKWVFLSFLYISTQRSDFNFNFQLFTSCQQQLPWLVIWISQWTTFFCQPAFWKHQHLISILDQLWLPLRISIRLFWRGWRIFIFWLRSAFPSFSRRISWIRPRFWIFIFLATFRYVHSYKTSEQIWDFFAFCPHLAILTYGPQLRPGSFPRWAIFSWGIQTSFRDFYCGCCSEHFCHFLASTIPSLFWDFRPLFDTVTGPFWPDCCKTPYFGPKGCPTAALSTWISQD